MGIVPALIKGSGCASADFDNRTALTCMSEQAFLRGNILLRMR
jgi:hypothetical protein